MAAGDDIAQSVAENIGVMPLVTKAGEMGSGFMDFLGSLLGGGKAKAPAPAKPQVQLQPQAAEQPDFLSGLWNAITGGGQGTVDAFRDDWGNIQEGKLPQHAKKDALTAMMMSGRGGFGPGMTKIPATRSVKKVFDPQRGWEEIDEVFTPSVDPIKSLFQGNLGGSQFSDLMLKILRGLRQNQSTIPETLRY